MSPIKKTAARACTPYAAAHHTTLSAQGHPGIVGERDWAQLDKLGAAQRGAAHRRYPGAATPAIAAPAARMPMLGEERGHG